MDEQPEPKRRNMLANSVFGVLSWFSPIVLGFISTPIIVSGLGVGVYGIYAIILGFLSYSFTFGIGRVAVKYVAEFNATGQTDKVSKAVSAALIFSFAIGFVGASTLAILTPWIVSDVLLLPESIRQTAETCLYISCITGLMVMISQVFQNTLQGIHRFGLYLVLTNVSAILLSSGNIALALAGHGIVALVAWNLFSVLTSGIIFYLAAMLTVPNLRPTFRIGREISTAVGKYSASIILYQIFANILFIFERSWIVRKFGPDALTFYAVPMVLGIYLHGLIYSFSQVIFPSINEYLHDKENLVALYKKTTRLVTAIIVMVVVTFIFSGKEFLFLWVGPEFAIRSYAVLVLHGLTFGLIASIITVWNIVEAFRATMLNVGVTLFWLIVGGGAMIAIGDTRGIEGIAAARLGAVILTMPLVLYVEKRLLGQVLAGFWLGLLLRIVPAALLLGSTQYLLNLRLPESWVGFVFAVGIGCLLYLLVLFFLGFFEEEEIGRAKKLIFRG